MPEEKRLVMVIWEAFKQSLRRPHRTAHFGDFKGEDYMGNKYYELGARPEVGRRKPSRWFESKNKDMMQEIPIEWESWLRNRREDVPTHEEIIRNRALSEMKRKKDQGKEARTKEEGKTGRREHDFDTSTPRNKFNRGSYPKYDDLEVYPGQHQDRKDDR